MAFRSITLATSTLLLSTSVNAALLERLNGKAYYDDQSNLTWLADAHASGITMSWLDANAWASSLDIDGVSGWRLPETMQPDPSCDDQLDGGAFGPQGYRHNCTGSEMGNMFYNVLGGTAFSDIAINHNSNYDLFSNIQSSIYWSGTEYANNLTSSWSFRFSSGDQRTFNESVDVFYAWAVQTGDVATVPVPASIWLFVSGLLGLVSLSKRS